MRLSKTFSPGLTSSRRFDFCLVVFYLVLVVPQFLIGILPSDATPFSKSQLGIVPVASAWEWTDYVVGGGTTDDDKDAKLSTMSDTEIANLRVRDLKRKLARVHGYGADELGRMLDKKDLIAALTKEETILRNKYRNKQRRKLLWKGVMIAIMCIIAIVGWPLWVQLSEVTAVNSQVYYDRKKHEISQCIEFRSAKGAVGVVLLAILDGIRFWLSMTVMASWFMASDSPYRKYMFPIPSFAIRPAMFMGEKVANGPMGRYGMNIAPMAITWCMGFVRAKLEYWTGKALSSSAKVRRKEARSGETEEERKARKAARKAAKRAAREEQERKQQEAWQKETERRKEMADKASEQLFGGGAKSSSEDTKADNQNESTIPDEGYHDAKRQFEANMDDFDDMNDLD